jgi:4-hydroxybenzoate polyprenyltransferase
VKDILVGVYRLTRFKEFFFFVAVTTLLGAIASQGQVSPKLFIVLLANWLAVGFAFMINDVEDAPDDALTPHKAARNPVSAGIISLRDARLASFITAALSAITYAFLGWVPFLLGLLCLALGFLYSWRGVRFKTMAGLDLLSHALMLAGLQYLCGYFTFQSGFNDRWLFPFLFVFCVSLYGELFNEVRDIEGDIKAGLHHTAIVLGAGPTHILMYILLGIGACSGVYSVFFVHLFPAWVLVVLVLLAIAFALPHLIKVRLSHSAVQVQEPLQKPLEIAAAFAFFFQILAPWMNGVLKIF